MNRWLSTILILTLVLQNMAHATPRAAKNRIGVVYVSDDVDTTSINRELTEKLPKGTILIPNEEILKARDIVQSKNVDPALSFLVTQSKNEYALAQLRTKTQTQLKQRFQQFKLTKNGCLSLEPVPAQLWMEASILLAQIFITEKQPSRAVDAMTLAYTLNPNLHFDDTQYPESFIKLSNQVINRLSRTQSADRKIAIKVSAIPENSQIYLNGKLVGTAPLKINLKNNEPQLLSAASENHVSGCQILDNSMAQNEITFNLKRKPAVTNSQAIPLVKQLQDSATLSMMADQLRASKIVLIHSNYSLNNKQHKITSYQIYRHDSFYLGPPHMTALKSDTSTLAHEIIASIAPENKGALATNAQLTHNDDNESDASLSNQREGRVAKIQKTKSSSSKSVLWIVGGILIAGAAAGVGIGMGMGGSSSSTPPTDATATITVSAPQIE